MSFYFSAYTRHTCDTYVCMQAKHSYIKVIEFSNIMSFDRISIWLMALLPTNWRSLRKFSHIFRLLIEFANLLYTFWRILQKYNKISIFAFYQNEIQILLIVLCWAVHSEMLPNSTRACYNLSCSCIQIIYL